MQMANKEKKVSIIIPTYNDLCYLKTTLNLLNLQTILPHEVIIIDSSSNNDIELFIKDFNSKYIIKYKRLYQKNLFDRIFPGRARNIGLEYSECTLISFLDTKTFPSNNWLESNLKLFNLKMPNIILGKTKYKSNLFFQQIYIKAIYGNKELITVPGSLLNKKDLNDCLFLENLRSGEDLEWKRRITKNFNKIEYSESPLTYSSFPSNISTLFIKFFIYSFNGALIDLQKNLKDIYFAIFIFLTVLIIPRWNYLIGNWDENKFYIPNVTKFYLLSFLLFLIFIIFYKNFFISRFKYLINSLYYSSLIIIFYIFFRWNGVIGNWAEETALYFPHITKIYISIVLLISFLYRGIILPIRNNCKLNELIPFKFIFIGIFGLIIDLVKAPGFILGSTLSIFNYSLTKSNQNKKFIIKK
tara:strand:- start:239 stop:1480 length:1242 start_codon:yes stop_codon:yes gene_type:complete